MPKHIPPLVMSVHGIRTYAEWQYTLAEVLNRRSIQFKMRRFGYYPVTSFVRSARNQRHVDEFCAWYRATVGEFDNVDTAYPAKRPSVIAHSFGAFIIGYSMLKYREIKFDKIILCGSILPTDFDWYTLFNRDQVGRVLNEHGGQDTWVSLARFAVRGTGPSGRTGFAFLGTRLSNVPYDFHKHSDFFQVAHIEESWLPFLHTEPSRFIIVHGADTDDPAYEKYIHRTRAIDRIRYGRLPAHSTVAIPFKYSRQWREANRDIYTFVVDRSSAKTCGYINAMPLTDEVFGKVMTGELLDNQIPGSAVVPFIRDQVLKIYFLSIAVAPPETFSTRADYEEAVENLLDAFFGQLRMYARTRRIRIAEVGAIGWTPEGERLCVHHFGMKRAGTLKVAETTMAGANVVEHPIYRLSLSRATVDPVARIHNGLSKLLDTYAELFDKA